MGEIKRPVWAASMPKQALKGGGDNITVYLLFHLNFMWAQKYVYDPGSIKNDERYGEVNLDSARSYFCF